MTSIDRELMLQTQDHGRAQKGVVSSFGVASKVTQVLWFGDWEANREIMSQGKM